MDKLHPTNPEWVMYDPELYPPPRGVELLLITEHGVLIRGPWFDGCAAWGYKPKIPATVKERMYGGKQETKKEV